MERHPSPTQCAISNQDMGAALAGPDVNLIRKFIEDQVELAKGPRLTSPLASYRRR
jgi:hypothetical protein